MAIATGTNSLNPIRRHLAGCSRFPKGSKQPLTHKPKTPQERKADSCRCPIWCLGYLAKETEIKNGKLRPKRMFVSLGTTDWTSAETKITSLYKIGALPAIAPSTSGMEIDKTAVTVRYAGERYLESGTGASLDTIKKSTLEKYLTLIKLRLFEYCDKNGILRIQAFEDRDVCQQFAEAWRQRRRNVGEFLGTRTRKIEMQRFSTFLNFCVDNGWLKKNGTERIKGKGQRKKDEEEQVRHGLELNEYRQILVAPPSGDLSAQANRETLAATELMRWSGLRISDAHKFSAAEIVPNESGDGWNCDFVQKKTGMRCVTPLPDHVKTQLEVLPGRVENGTKYFFTCSYTALRMRVDTLAERAQKEKPFAHPFSPHCLRHTFAIQHFNHGTPVEYVSKWLGHENVAVTIKHYRRWISTTKQIAESVGRNANAKMLAHDLTMRN
jgi:integrase